MPLTPATCPKCGGILDVDSELEAAVCKYCGTPFIVEKAITNYNITNNSTYVTNKTNTTNIENSEVHIHNDGTDAQTLFDNLKVQIGRGNINAALLSMNKLQDNFPADPRTYEAEFLCEWNGGGIDYLIEHGTAYHCPKCFSSLSELISVNREVGTSYSERIKNETNAYLKKICGKDFTGDLALYKIALLILYKSLRKNEGPSQYKNICELVDAETVADTKMPNEPKGYDDEYKRNYNNKSNLNAEFFDTVRNGFIKLMSPSGKAAYEENRKKEAYEKAERKKAESREKIKTLWNEYTDLLKSGKTKDAYSLMEKSDFYKYNYRERGCFKKGLFGMKYNGNATERSADDVLEELGLNE